MGSTCAFKNRQFQEPEPAKEALVTRTCSLSLGGWHGGGLDASRKKRARVEVARGVCFEVVQRFAAVKTYLNCLFVQDACHTNEFVQFSDKATAMIHA